MKIILASKSPRRKELLGIIYKDFEISVSGASEPEYSGGSVTEYVCSLAQIKGEAILEKEKNRIDKCPEDIIIISADTIVVKDGNIYGKPKNSSAAKDMLGSLSGDVHEVYTGVCINKISVDGSISQKVFYEKTAVFVNELTPEEIDEYIATGDPFDKAGGYGIQGVFAKHICKIEGDYTNVVGFPVSRVYSELKTI